MTMFTSRQLIGFLSSLVLILSFSVVVLSEVKTLNYVVTGQLPDGQNTFMRYGDVVVRESSISETSVRRQYKLTLMLRQIAAGPDFLQLIYKITNRNNGKKTRLVECEVINDWRSANEFRNSFERQLQHVGVNTSPISLQNKRDDGGGDDADDINEDNDDELSPENELEPYRHIDLEFDPETVEPLHRETIDLNQGLIDLQNVTVRMLRDDEMVGDLNLAFDVKLHQENQQNFGHVVQQILQGQKQHCRRLHRRLRRRIQQQQQLQKISSSSSSADAQEKNSRVRRSEVFPIGIIPGTYWCGFGKVASQSSSIGPHAGTDICCRQHDHCPVILPALTTQYGVFNYRMNTISHCSCDENRSKRELSMSQLTDTFRFPGTKWCGVGYTALEARDLGGYMGADKCCRGHDLGCPFFIEAFTEKYDLFNWRMYTIMHCACDERFRSCLKQTNTGAADFVGKLFFNIVSTKCFVLKPEPTCSKRSWWGKCLKMEYKKQAHLRDPTPY